MKKYPTLIEKVCRCGCGKTWRAMPNSPCEYAMAAHKPKHLRENEWDADRGGFRRKVREWLDNQFGKENIEERYDQVIQDIPV